MLFEFSVKTSSRSEFIDITRDVNAALAKSGAKSGICLVYIPHTTAGVVINENADPDVPADIIRSLEKTAPWTAGYAHSEGNSAAHIKSVLTGISKELAFEKGRLVLGTWQGIFFAEFDGPRTRKVFVKIVADK